MFVKLDTIRPIEMISVDSPTGRLYHIPTGEKYPSITTILGSGEKPWLKEWRESMGEENADREMARAATRGTAVHLMLERYLQNDPNPTLDQLPEHIIEFNSLKLYMKKVNNILAQEIALVSHTLGVAGRVDCIAHHNNTLSIIYFKTSNNNKSANIIHDYFMQTTFYALAFEEMYHIQIDNLVIMMSVERGTTPLIFHEKVDNWIEPLIKRIVKYKSGTVDLY
jgi:hypothetical protein